MTGVTVAALADMVGGRLLGDGTRAIVGLGDIKSARADQIGFVRDARYQNAARTTKAGALLLKNELETEASQILVDDVDLAYAKVALFFHPVPRATQHRIHATAVVHPEAEITAPVDIGPRAVVGRSRLGAGCVVMAGAVIGDGCELAGDCVLYPNATLYPRVQLGARVVVHANAVIGSDGFGYAKEGEAWVKVPQLGNVVLGDDVEIGAGTAVDRATLGSTRIGPRTKIDNLCHIAHNCSVGADCAMAAGAMIAGSTVVGDRCVFGGQVGVSGHLTIAADVRLGGGSVVLKDVTESGDYMGQPLLEKRRFVRLLKVLRGMVSEDG